MLPESLEAINARQRELERITADMQAEEIERAREWQQRRGEGLGVLPGATVRAQAIDELQQAADELGIELPEDICDFVPSPDMFTTLDEPYQGSILDDPEVNPKERAATRDQKPPLHLLEHAADVQIAQALAYGAHKYGRKNFYDTPILANVYGGAIRRHIGAWLAGEHNDLDSDLSHLAHIGANIHVLFAAMQQGTFVDDRGPEERSAVQERMSRSSNAARP